MEKKWSFVTIAYEGDLRMLILQLISVDRLFDLAPISKYYIVLNTKDSKLKSLLLFRLKYFLSKKLYSLIELILVSDLLSIEDVESSTGQRSQQLIKMMISNLVQTEQYIILDAKNFFTDYSDIGLFVDDKGNFLTYMTSLTENWAPYVEASFNALNVDLTDEIRKEIIPTITPYVIDTKLMRELIDELKSTFGNDLSLSFKNSHGKVTEFFLYLAYLHKSNSFSNYKKSKPICRTFFASWPSEYSEVDQLIKNFEKDKIYMLGLHRQRLSQLSVEHIKLLEKYLDEKLLRPWEALSWFIDSEKQSIF